jgi:glycerophosphoryl diester phosphodiesterase
MIVLLLAACGGSDPSDSDTDAGAGPFDGHAILDERPMVIAHRGGGNLAPEETMMAFENAVAVGADMLEMDAWSTTDGVIVLNHDDTVDRTTDGTGAISNMSWAEVQALDAAYDFTTDGGETFPLRGTGVRIARLDEVLAAFPDLLFSIEVKQNSPSITEAVLGLVNDAGLHDRVVLGSFDPGPISEIRTADPTMLTSLTVGEGLAFYGLTPDQEAAYVPPAPLLAAPTELGGIVLDAATVEKAHRVGLTVHVWTVNDRAEMEAVLDMGANKIITDDPALLREVYDERGL